MSAPLQAAGGALAVALASLVAAPPRVVERRSHGPGIASCRICHPAAVEALRVSVHAELAERACSLCHRDAGRHAESARRAELALVPPPPWASDAGRVAPGDAAGYTRGGAHRWVRSEQIARAELAGEPVTAAPAPLGPPPFDWQGLLHLGYRIVSRTGSADRYATDVDLDPGLRLVEARLTGRGETDWLDRIDLRARDVGDPWTRLSAEFEKAGRFRARAGREERVFVMRTSGDYSRVEHEQRTTSLGLDLPLGDELTAYADVERFHDDGIWLTQRLAGRSTPADAPVGGVTSPRRTQSDRVRAGLRGVVDDTRFLVGGEYLDERTDDRWSFLRPAPADPSFDESEDFRSLAELTGPGAELSLGRDLGPLRLEFDARHRELEREVGGRGLRRGFDVVEFETDTQSAARGDARTTWIELDGIAELSDRVTFSFDVAWRDYDEHMRLAQVETTRFPGTGGSVVVRDDRDLITEQTRWSGSASLEVEPIDDLRALLGYGFSREELRLPDLVAGDTDPTGGTLRDAGLIAGLDWRLAEDWRLRARYTDFGQTGMFLHEQQEDDARTASGSLRYGTESTSVELFARHRRARNDRSSFRSSSDAFGLTATLAGSAGLDLFASWVFADIDSRTLTSFWFDPDPIAVPTVVGFRGRTHTGVLGLELTQGSLRWRNDFSLTHTSGSFDVDTLRFASDLSWELIEDGSLGLRYERIEYEDELRVDNFEADLVMIAWQQRFGGRRD